MVIPVSERIEYLQGSVERVTFHSEETGFCVLRVKVKGHRDFVTVVGSAASITAGEYVECQGDWVNDKKHGLQFKAKQLKTIQPTTLEGIQKYLGSGMVKGIGPHFAKKLVRAFGATVFDVIEQTPRRLRELEGIGKKRQQMVTSAWAEQKSIRNIMVFLQSHGVGTARSVRIYKTYGDNAVEKVKENPYRLALDIRGIGFKTADRLAGELGIAKDSLIRAQAGVRHVLQTLCDHGHCAAPRDDLLESSHALLDIPTDIIEQAIECEIQQENLKQTMIREQTCIYLIALYIAEKRSSELLKQLNTFPLPWGQIDCTKAIPWVEKKTGFALSNSQSLALQTVLQSKLTIITGGPGVGKTTLVNSLIYILRVKKLKIALCAPTGRAAKRLSETTGMSAMTIHRLLDFDPTHHGFKHNLENPLDIDLLIIDESSMLDIVLFHQLLKAIPKRAGVVFVGDIDQLPSVGSGAVLSDLIRSKMITTVRLTEIFRQAASSQIVLNAHRINQGKMPLSNGEHHVSGSGSRSESDFFVLYEETPEAIYDTLIDVVAHRLPKHYGFRAKEMIQVLTPMNRGGLGSRSLNEALQKRLNGCSEPKIAKYGSTYSPGDKVIQMVNNYDKEVFNGDIGCIESIDLAEGIVRIRFDAAVKVYDTSELDEIQLAYAISIHKSQGSEFPVVVMPLATQHYALLARNLLYTGVTRAKRLLVLIAQKKALGMAIHNNKAANRLTKLAERLQE